MLSSVAVLRCSKSEAEEGEDAKRTRSKERKMHEGLRGVAATRESRKRAAPEAVGTAPVSEKLQHEDHTTIEMSYVLSTPTAIPGVTIETP